jgi:hypothetical protein
VRHKAYIEAPHCEEIMLNGIDSFSLCILAVVACRSQSPHGGKFGFTGRNRSQARDYDASQFY